MNNSNGEDVLRPNFSGVHFPVNLTEWLGRYFDEKVLMSWYLGGYKAPGSVIYSFLKDSWVGVS